MADDENDQPEQPEDDDAVGYGKPPKHTQFKPGQSGNPKGRPKRSKNFVTDLREELHETIPVRENGKVKTLPKQRAILKALMSKALKGETRAIQTIVGMVEQYLLDEIDEAASPALGPDDEEILKLFEQNERAGLENRNARD